jgi:hypothetical protein
MKPLTTPWPLVAGAMLTTAAGFAGGWLLASRLAQAQVVEMNARRIECEHAREKDARAAAEAAAALLARAQGAEAEAAARLAQAQAAARSRLEDARREVYQLATGRPCLPDAVRLRLNAAIGAADGLPAGAGDAAFAATEPAADPGHGEGRRVSTDADVAGWALDAAALYEQCRARLDAIRQWDAMTFGDR